MKIHYNGGDEKHHFNILDSDSKVLFESSSFSNKNKCLQTIYTLIVEGIGDTFQFKTDPNDRLKSVVVDGNQDVILRSIRFKSESDRTKHNKDLSGNIKRCKVSYDQDGDHREVRDEIDVEDCACKGEIPYIAFKYVIRINNTKHKLLQSEITGTELLALVGLTPDTAFLRQKVRGQKVIIKPNEVVDLANCGVERFITQKKNAQEGLAEGAFVLPTSDREFLSSSGLSYEAIQEGNNQWLLIRDYEIPDGYSRSKVDVALHIPGVYPMVQIDMIYFHPGLQRKDAQPIGALSKQIIEGKTYQRWSRHRNNINPWVPGEDDVQSHLDLMMFALKEEFKKR